MSRDVRVYLADIAERCERIWFESSIACDRVVVSVHPPMLYGVRRH